MLLFPLLEPHIEANYACAARSYPTQGHEFRNSVVGSDSQDSHLFMDERLEDLKASLRSFKARGRIAEHCFGGIVKKLAGDCNVDCCCLHRRCGSIQRGSLSSYLRKIIAIKTSVSFALGVDTEVNLVKQN